MEKKEALNEYKLRKSFSYPSHEDVIQEVDNEPKPVGKPAPDGMDTIPDPDEEDAIANQGQQSPAPAPQPKPQPQAPQQPQQTTPTPQPQPEPQMEVEPEEDETEDILKKLEDKINSQDNVMKKILNILSPEPEQTPEEKIISKIDALSKEVANIKNADEIKKEKIKNLSPFNTSLSNLWTQAEEEAEEELKITQADVDNYNPSEVRKSLGIPSHLGINENFEPLSEPTTPKRPQELQALEGKIVKALGSSGSGQGKTVVGVYHRPTKEKPYDHVIATKGRYVGMTYEVNPHSVTLF